MHVNKTEGPTTSRDTKSPKQTFWWDWSIEKPARALSNWMNNIERTNWQKRWSSLTYYRYMTGRYGTPPTFNYSSIARPPSANVYSRAQFEVPAYNVLRQCSDALHNRVYMQRPLAHVVPEAGMFKARIRSKKLTRWLDGAWHDYNLWDVAEECADDSRTYGSAFLKVDVDPNKEIRVTKLLSDEVIIDDNECNTGQVLHWGIRLFVSRQSMRVTYKGDVPALAAIDRAPKSANGFYFGGDLDTTDVIVLREAYCPPQKGVKGRHILATDDYCFIDEEWKQRVPIAKLVFKPVGFYGQGMPEMVLGLQREVDRLLAAISENMRRAAWPRIAKPTGSNINEGALGDTSNGIYDYTGTDATFHFPTAMSSDQFQHFNSVILRIKETFRLNDQVFQGQQPKQISGVAVEKINQNDDNAHADLFHHYEDFILDVNELLILAAEIAKPTVRVQGRTTQEIKWSDVELAQNSYSLKMISVAGLSMDAGERQNQIDVWEAKGSISKETAMRISQVPDVDGFLDLVNASRDYVEDQIDTMIEHGTYEPPEPWIDLVAALQDAQSHYLLEKINETPQDRLDLLLRWMAQIQEMIAEASPPPAAPPPPPGPLGRVVAAPAFGIQPPPGPGPAPSPYPLAPALPPPTQTRT